MSLLRLRGIQLAFGGPNLLDHVDLVIEPGERCCLVGRNGAGKSTLMKVIAGELKPDGGKMESDGGLKVARLRQEVPRDASGSVFDVVAAGLGEIGEALRRYHDAIHAITENPDEANMKRLEAAQHRLEAQNGWELEQRVEATLSRLDLDADADFGALSGGWKRRVLLAQALVEEPDLLLLDEPTNHLDIEAIAWLEDFLLNQFRGALLFITHDRAFLQRLATRILDLDLGRLTAWDCDYHTYLERKEAAMEAEAQQNALFDKKLAQEEVWIRQGIKARRTRNEGRVRALKALREERAQRRSRQGEVKLTIQAAERSGKLVAELKDVSYAWQGKPIVRRFSSTLMRGDKVGIIGPNGCGKTTLLNLILGRIEPDSGNVKLGTKIEVAYFDQYRAQLDEERTVRDQVADNADHVTINGGRRHVMSYLADFLFEPARANQPVKALSGGERNRLLLARLFAQPANVLVLDEPTNDLDLETLELLEERLMDFDGTVLLVSHDRAFLDNVVTSSLVFEGGGLIGEYVGGYSDVERQSPGWRDAVPVNDEPTPKPEARPVEKSQTAAQPTKKRSYKDQREYDALPAQIEKLDAGIETLEAAIAAPEFYQQDKAKIAAELARLEALQVELERCYERWAALE
ncbi:MAG: ATP-binding cassette domain-containing protein [Gammaproteobacteria bacterium]|nr:ATP-binding cassette domain-containing protein [Gammaproteobacteria bacterium]MCP5136643.1 ATP-binding cassette domain-containing protein [Gammaproteobacteria bacterium]